MVSLVAKKEYVIINSNWTQEIMAGQKKKLRCSEETPGFPEYYIGWIGIDNCGQKTSSMYVHFHNSKSYDFWAHVGTLQLHWNNSILSRLRKDSTYHSAFFAIERIR